MAEMTSYTKRLQSTSSSQYDTDRWSYPHPKLNHILPSVADIPFVWACSRTRKSCLRSAWQTAIYSAQSATPVQTRAEGQIRVVKHDNIRLNGVDLAVNIRLNEKFFDWFGTRPRSTRSWSHKSTPTSPHICTHAVPHIICMLEWRSA